MMEAHDTSLSVELTGRFCKFSSLKTDSYRILATKLSLMLTNPSDTRFLHRDLVLILTMPVSSSKPQLGSYTLNHNF